MRLALLPVLAAALLAVSPAAAAPKARVLDPAPYNALRPGETTKADAVRALGEPDAAMPSREGHSTLIYEYDVPATDTEGPRHLVAVLLFDPDDRFVRYRLYFKDPEAAGE